MTAGDKRLRYCLVFLNEADFYKYPAGSWIVYPSVHPGHDQCSEDTSVSLVLSQAGLVQQYTAAVYVKACNLQGKVR